MAYMVALNPQRANTNFGRFINMFVTVLAACVLSAPGNELRGYCLQDPSKCQSFVNFFQPAKFVRSTSVGGLIMAISLGVGTLATPQVEKLWVAIREYLKKNPLGYLIAITFFAHQIIAWQRHQKLVKALEDNVKVKTSTCRID